jgi:hypothetical protein
MKKNLILLVAILSATVLFTSCKKERTDEIKNVTLDVTINAGEVYKLDLSKYGDADDVATITKQAATFATSEIAKVGTIGEYNFMKDGAPKTGGNGNETVVLKVSEGQRGNGGPAPNAGGEHHGKKCNVDETNITINFTIL